ncbi:unnamed protein product [Timema podura]|uniref:Uncharacterized protein n=1 Tax=Timema podura TaxID=61482 RepID=A0ABN7NIE2_TIMPD|nr:unnamed protein product [Timema podura]
MEGKLTHIYQKPSSVHPARIRYNINILIDRNQTHFGGRVVKGEYTAESGPNSVGTGRNKVHMTLGRGDLGAKYECRAENAALSAPIVSNIRVEVNVSCGVRVWGGGGGDGERRVAPLQIIGTPTSLSSSPLYVKADKPVPPLFSSVTAAEE